MSSKPKDLTFNEDASEKMKAGLDKLANAVKVTLGPRGRNVIIERAYGSPTITKDGVSVAKEVDLLDPIENLGAQLVKDVAAKQGDLCGDGTSTATVLAQSLLEQGTKVVAVGASPVELKRGMDIAVELFNKELILLSKEISTNEEVAQVGTISANNERKVGDLLAEAIEKVGNDGVITIEETGGEGLSLDLVEGMELSEGYMSAYFNTEADKTSEITMTRPLFLLVDKEISSLQEIVPALKAANEANVPIVLICKGLSKPVMDGLIVNVVKGAVKVVAIRAPGYGAKQGDSLRDLATATGATLFGDETSGAVPLSKLEDLNMLGQADKVTVSKNKTVIFEALGDEDEIQSKIESLKAEAEKTPSEYDKEKLLERVSKLSGGIAVIGVGGNSEVEIKELRDRVEDAMHATRAAIEMGIVPGGGTALLFARKNVVMPEGLSEDQQRGFNIVMNAVEAPLRNILINAGESPDVILDKILNGNGVGYNAHTGQYEDLVESGVIDPVKVTTNALKNSASIAGMLLTTSCAITISKEAIEPLAQPMGMM